MKKIALLIFSILLISITTTAQELTCADFKIGQFYIPETKEMAKYTIVSNDSISEYTPERDSIIKKYIVIREENTQIEWINEIGSGNPEYEKIEWIDDCTYRLTYDSSKYELDEGKKWINENNGIIVSKIKIEHNCLFYTATITTNEGKKISQDGIICKN
ncbi:hypothetical protein [Marixanthomonas ophiurae]|uniref:Uncharacterized protein n=1 Tax=Marixanthomonas ophiurae TaxID=387659 RepID=A0A3E1QDA7_9FLAO|nr:hypothetical protein [Marixanthomonas ophiurae]RFN60139.1 hypothetical protein DZ858_08880 [Marixanthomonas ophiurae]